MCVHFYAVVECRVFIKFSEPHEFVNATVLVCGCVFSVQICVVSDCVSSVILLYLYIYDLFAYYVHSKLYI